MEVFVITYLHGMHPGLYSYVDRISCDGCPHLIRHDLSQLSILDAGVPR